MKIATVMALVAGFAIFTSVAHAQGDASSKKNFKPAPMHSALYILKSDYRTMELDPKKNEVFDVRSVNPRFVRFVTVLDGERAKKIYGEKGAHGVVIVQFEDHYTLSKETVAKIKKQ